MNVLDCSPLSIEMVRKMGPKEAQLSTAANSPYPTNTYTIFWLLDSLEIDNKEYAKVVANNWVELHPYDALAWGRLGRILQSNGEYEEGLKAYLNACSINDHESNGCFYVGVIYKKSGDYEKAIYYFRLSYWQPSQIIADELEAMLNAEGK